MKMMMINQWDTLWRGPNHAIQKLIDTECRTENRKQVSSGLYCFSSRQATFRFQLKCRIWKLLLLQTKYFINQPAKWKTSLTDFLTFKRILISKTEYLQECLAVMGRFTWPTFLPKVSRYLKSVGPVKIAKVKEKKLLFPDTFSLSTPEASEFLVTHLLLGCLLQSSIVLRFVCRNLAMNEMLVSSLEWTNCNISHSLPAKAQN